MPATVQLVDCCSTSKRTICKVWPSILTRKEVCLACDSFIEVPATFLSGGGGFICPSGFPLKGIQRLKNL